MILQAWLFVGVVAILASGMALLTTDDGVAVLTGVLGFVAWGVWVFGSLNLQVVRDATVYTFSSPVVAFIGIAFALVPAWIALTGPVEIIGRWREGDHREL